MNEKIVVRTDIPLGTWQGMGGAITEATAYNFAKLDLKKQQKLINAYYGKNGLNYSWGRISVGSNDFCLKPYEYSKKLDLSDFSIEHDRRWLLPMLKKILKQKKIKLIAAPWSPPKTMKLSIMGGLSGFLKPWHYGNYAKYIHKWLNAYAKENIRVNYLSPQNEPHALQEWESCFYSYKAQKRLAYQYLAKELDDLDTQILLWDHNKKHLSKVADKLFDKKYSSGHKITGLCYHWYDGTYADQMWQVRQKYPDILMISSEMCCGFSPYDKKKWLHDANLYISEIFADINSGTNAWIDWNMLLDWNGGPSHCKNYVKSPVILNEAEDDFILTPIYDALKKIARLFPPGSNVVRCEYDSRNIVAIARRAGSGYKVIVSNTSNQKQTAIIKLDNKEKYITLSKYETISVSI